MFAHSRGKKWCVRSPDRVRQLKAYAGFSMKNTWMWYFFKGGKSGSSSTWNECSFNIFTAVCCIGSYWNCCEHDLSHFTAQGYETRMHSSRMRTARSLPFGGGVSLSRGVSVRRSLSREGSLSRGSLSRRASVQRGSLSGGHLCPGGLCAGGLCAGRSLSRWGGLCLGAPLSRGVSVQGGLCPGGSPWQRPPREHNHRQV